MADWDCFQLVSKVSFPKCFFLGILPHQFSRCDATSDNLDGAGSHRRSHEKTDFLITNFDPGILWDDFGIRHDIVVCISIVFRVHDS